MKKWILILGLMVSFNANAICDEEGYYDCGHTGDVKWYLSSDQSTLTVLGNGSTGDYGFVDNPYFIENDTKTAPFRTTAPWGKYNDKIETINVEEGVVRLGNVCFAGLDHVTNVNLPQTLSVLGYSSLDQLSSLTSLVIPDNVTKVAQTAFAWTNSLVSLDVGDGFEIEGSGLQYLGITPDQHSEFARTYANTKIYCNEDMIDTCRQMGNINIIPYKKQGNEYILDGVRYKNSLDMQKGQNGHKIKRIYTIDEANQVTGKTNTFSIRYR